MKRMTFLVVLACVAVVALSSLAMATESTKCAAAWSGTQVVPATADSWATVLSASLKTGAPKDVAVLFTAESLVATYVKVHAKKVSGALAVDTDSSEAALLVRCLVDGVEAYPGPITFDSRLMKLSAFLGEAIYTDPGTGELLSAGDQWISIYERTRAAHAFSFCLGNLGSGEHLIEIQCQIVVTPSHEEVAPEVTEAYLGARMMVCDEVNLKSRVYPQ
ncbi:MAG: hypothetical protein GTO55_01515 [Armatimonadetes bacterium]|nr:hypothetical protein [Armatimonadota bacterium]NIM22955.1 hypothetical protein [Armatimonadota bacterium]NIM66826.1 hypothetical protein [Armatimonadota bacterium]NIM75367.1 hypothetical protein [Armatimonadota bacterium]NIN05014.1 hypothetical protein [Armatimonadota bacterium]